MKIATREIVTGIDRETIKNYGIPGAILMENAGRALTEVICREFPEARSVSVIAGAGNNGGDGFVSARHLLSRGRQVKTYTLSDPKTYKGDAKLNLNSLKKIGGSVERLRKNFSNFSPADVVVDAIFGTGLTRQVSGQYKSCIEFINSLETPTIAVDIPSGLDCDTGRPLGAAVRADITVTFILPKLGLVTHPGLDYTGQLFVASITSPQVLEKNSNYELLSSENLSDISMPRKADTHKGTYGHLLIIAGSPGKTGAGTLASLGAQRVGTGLVTLGIPEGLNEVMEQKTTETMTEPLPETDGRTLGPDSLKRTLSILKERKTALAIGPGISTSDETAEYLVELLRKTRVPTLIDADGLTLIANEPKLLGTIKTPLVLTPHPGEMSRLTGLSTDEIQQNRVELSKDYSRKNGIYLVLKGSRTIVSTPKGKVYINPTGNPGMASGGTGDVLTGVIGGLLAERINPEDASRLGVYVHGLAGDFAAEVIGQTGYTAKELANFIPAAMDSVRRQEPKGIEIIY